MRSSVSPLVPREGVIVLGTGASAFVGGQSVGCYLDSIPILPIGTTQMSESPPDRSLLAPPLHKGSVFVVPSLPTGELPEDIGPIAGHVLFESCSQCGRPSVSLAEREEQLRPR
jgi:hypothetical protein